MKRKKRTGILRYTIAGYPFLSIGFVFICFSYYFLIVFFMTIQASNEMSNSLFDYVIHLRGGGSASTETIMLGVLPIILLLLPMYNDQIEKYMVILRLKDRRVIHKHQFFFSLTLAFFLTVWMVIIGVGDAWIEIGHLSNLWESKEGMFYYFLDNKATFSFYKPYITSGRVWFYILLSRFLAILCLTMFVWFLKLLLRKNVNVFFGVILFFSIDGLLSKKFSLFMGRVKVNLDTWASPGDQWFNLLYFVLVIIILYMINLKMYQNREFYAE